MILLRLERGGPSAFTMATGVHASQADPYVELEDDEKDFAGHLTGTHPFRKATDEEIEEFNAPTLSEMETENEETQTDSATLTSADVAVPTGGEAADEEFAVLDETVDDLEAALATGQFDDRLDALEAAEVAGKDRDTAYAAIDDRREDIADAQE